MIDKMGKTLFTLIVSSIIALVVVSLHSQTGSVPNGVQSIPLNPAGYCATQKAPFVNTTVVYSWCADATVQANGQPGTWYGAVSGQAYSPIAQGPPGPAPGKNCTSVKLNGVNADGTWNQTCTTGWQ